MVSLNRKGNEMLSEIKYLVENDDVEGLLDLLGNNSPAAFYLNQLCSEVAQSRGLDVDEREDDMWEVMQIVLDDLAVQFDIVKV